MWYYVIWYNSHRGNTGIKILWNYARSDYMWQYAILTTIGDLRHLICDHIYYYMWCLMILCDCMYVIDIKYIYITIYMRLYVICIICDIVCNNYAIHVLNCNCLCEVIMQPSTREIERAIISIWIPAHVNTHQQINQHIVMNNTINSLTYLDSLLSYFWYEYIIPTGLVFEAKHNKNPGC